MIRLFLAEDLKAGARVSPTAAQAHYLTRVMRLALDAPLLVFNGRDGEWRARLAEAGKRGCVLAVETMTRPWAPSPDLDLVMALVKRPRLESIVEKAAELGARRVRLAITLRTNADRANLDRLGAIAIEAAEQTGRLDAPEILGPEPLAAILADCEARGRRLMFCDEAGEAPPAAAALMGAGEGAGVGGADPGPWAVLVGPEGGFSAGERAAIRAAPFARPVSLGPRILRADTAAIVALALWQSMLGDWRGP